MMIKQLKHLTVLAGGAAAVAVILSAVLFFDAQAQAGQTEVVFLDVGQGDSILIKTKYGQRILIDGGKDMRVLDRLGRNLSFFDRTLDIVIATHPDADHVGGLVAVLERYEVKLVLDPCIIHDSSVNLALHEVIENRGIALRCVESFQQYDLGRGITFEVLYPDQSFVGQDIDDNNTASIVSLLRDGAIDYLFTGDAPIAVEEELVAHYGKMLDVEILKVGHHGSKTSTSDALLAATAPEAAIIQVGAQNHYGHPGISVINRLNRAGITVLRNDELGDILLRSNGERVWLAQ